MKSFTLIELIFVIIIVGLISIGAINAFPDNTLINNTSFIYNKILEKKANSLGFNADMNNAEENRTVCIKFDKQWLKDDENYSKVRFSLSNRIEIDVSSNRKTICFDYLGRPYNGDVDLDNFSNLLHDETNITIKYKQNTKIITIYHITGDVEIQ